MDTVVYRNKKLPTVKIPKGTLLFRMLKNAENDVRGVLINETDRCISPFIHVFFYPDPFTAEITWKNSKYIDDFDKNVYVYILTRDISVLKLTNPSQYTRRNALPSCHTMRRGCLPRKLSKYDVCFSPSMIAKYPNVVGYIGNNRPDARRLLKNIKNPENQPYKKYLHYVEDAERTLGIPELAIYPLYQRVSHDVIVKPDTVLTNNYKLLEVFDRDNKSKIIEFMDRHARFNQHSHYYEYL